MKKVLVFLVTAFLLLAGGMGVSASEDMGTKADAGPPGGAGSNVTSAFSLKMRQNAAKVAYYRQHDKTYPIGTGLYFAERVKSNGVWDYKRSYGTTIKYKWSGSNITGEGLGNMHYGYVGRAAGFSATTLRSAAGAVQIYSGTAHGKWYKTYFDDPADQTYINKGINYWNNKNIPLKIAPSNDSYNFNSPETQELEKLLGEGPDFSLLSDEDKAEIRAEAEKNNNEILAEQENN